jgi:hypothetical protein
MQKIKYHSAAEYRARNARRQREWRKKVKARGLRLINGRISEPVDTEEEKQEKPKEEPKPPKKRRPRVGIEVAIP